MSVRAWTPGPWQLIWHGNERYPYPLSILTADGALWIARDGRVSSEANARLIAAAPAMYEALSALRDWVAFDGGAGDTAPPIEMMVNALAAAEGRS